MKSPDRFLLRQRSFFYSAGAPNEKAPRPLLRWHNSEWRERASRRVLFRLVFGKKSA
jgi:hypothetical protein